MESLVANYIERGHLEAAIDLQRHAVKGMLKTFGDKSLVAARSGSILSLIFAKNGQYSEVENNQITIVERLRRIYGKDDPNTLRARRILPKIRSDRKSATTKHRASSQRLPLRASNPAGEASSEPTQTTQSSSGSWSWRTYPTYRLTSAALDKFLVSIFGRYEFYVKVNKCPSPAKLTLT